jgi:hypothetical protein
VSKRAETIKLVKPSPGKGRELKVHHYSRPGAVAKAYFHAALHSGEYLSPLVANHLMALLMFNKMAVSQRRPD